MSVQTSNVGEAERIARALSEFVRVPSVNPLQAGPISGPGGERAMAEIVAERAADLGAEVELEVVLDDRPNVYASFEGTSDHTVAIDVHLDTVGIEHMTDDPFDGRIEDGRVYGRGSVDTKASFAVVLDVLRQMKTAGQKPVPNVLLVGTIAEEVGGLLGAVAFGRWLKRHDRELHQLIVAEPTLCAPVHGHKGALGLDVEIRGVAAHSSTPELGLNAISAASRVVAAMDAENERLVAAGGTTAVGPGTVSVTKIKGGAAPNIIPPDCRVLIGRRLAPGEVGDEVIAHLEALITEAAAPAEVTVALSYGRAVPAFYSSPDTPLVQDLARWGGTEPTVATYGSNALVYDGVCAQAALFGPGSIDQAHKAVEWVDMSELARAADVYRTWLTSSAARNVA